MKALPESSSEQRLDKCSRCVVVGNGGILRGLELGPFIDQFDTVIRLNSGPLGEFVGDVGNRTSLRMAYPESTPLLWADPDPGALFVAVVYKAVDLDWVSAMVRKTAVPLWDRLFFWQKVPAQVPIESGRFRLLNPEVIRETALDLLKYPPPRPRLWGWDPMEDKSSVPKFDCYKEPATLGPRWTRWLTAFELFADGKGLILDARVTDNTKIRRRALLLHAGTDVQDIFSTLDDTGGSSDYDKAVKALNDYFVPKVNNAFARQTFYQLSQNAGETVQQFVTRLRRTAKDCAFGGDLSNQLRDAVLSKCSSEYVRRKLLEEGSELVLDKALEIAAQCERVEEQMAAMRVNDTDIKGAEAVNQISKGRGERGKFRKREGEEKGKVCFRCGHGDHFAKDQKCPARGQTCRQCNGKDHYAKMCKSKGKRATQAEFTVIAGQGVPLLGRQTATELGVLRVGVDVAAVTDVKTEVQGKYPKLFTGVGKLNTKQVRLHIDGNVEPVAQPLRRVPFHLREAVDRKIEELLRMDIIEKVEGPTPWVNPVVVVPKAKDKDIRLCLDMRMANRAIIRGRYPIPTVDELLHDMNGSAVFSKLDLRWGYHQLELTEESRAITTFAVHSGTYRYKRLIFGVSSASEQYQHEVTSALTGIEGVANISDDIIVHAPDHDTHRQRLHAVLERLEKCGLTLNGEKCQFEMDKLVFMGILLTEKGVGPTSERVRALEEAREPENASEVRSFLGLAGYSSRFIPQFATISEPLRRLTKKEVPFVFGPEQQVAFETLKLKLAEAGTLAYFHKDAPTKVIADAGPVGIGAVLIQEQQGAMVPICYVSRSLTDCETRYSQTEKEALALVWACERLHPYIYGKRFDLVTDHKALQVIYSPKSKPCARIERWVLRLQPYDFRVVHIAGKFNIADPLSRLLGKSAKSTPHHHGAEEYVRFVAVQATPRALTTREVERASAEDKELDEVRKAIKTGRFEKCSAYGRIANELCTIGQLVLRGTRIVLPQSLRSRALILANEGHLGMVGMKQHLRGKVWWPGMYKATEKYVKACDGCKLEARPDVPEPLRPTALPDGPWQDLATDLLGPLPTGHSILVVVDYYSRYYEYEIMRSTTAEKVIDSLENIFSRHGLPVSIRSDCGPQFLSTQFQDFCKENGIQHVKTTPKWAQANGEVERQNASIMKRIRIAHAEGLDWQKELRKYVTVYRSIEHSTTGRSPAELLFNRKLRGKLPDISTPRIDIEARDTDAENKGKYAEYADQRRGAKPSPVQVGDEVLLKQDKVKAIHVHTEQFSVENRLLTPTMKAKRNELRGHFRDHIDSLYAQMRP
uniref:Gypsy retrotransposon integrase-like protein 1 n=1 Tax=Knipowitschia caucasica TaxID=637954 RepID=A0AAV2MLX7_KNICA